MNRARLVKSLSTNTVTMSLEMPGMNKSDVHINVQNGQLIVSGERRPTPKPEGDASVVDDELIYGRFMKIMQLPSGVGVSCGGCSAHSILTCDVLYSLIKYRLLWSMAC